MEDEQRLKNKLARYLANRCSADELPELLAYLQTEPGNRLLQKFMAQDDELNGEKEKPNYLDSEISNRVFRRLSDSIGRTPLRSQSVFFRKNIWQMAAAFMGVLLLVSIGYYGLNQSTLLTIVTNAGQKRTVLLPDGSRAILNANSRLVYNSRWEGEQKRRVELEGEAFFDITHDDKLPFYVKTSRLEVKVLGTAFNVKSDQINESFETTLLRGKVTVRDLEVPERAETALKPNEKAVFSPQKSNLPVAIQTVGNETGRNAYWPKGRLVFEDEPVKVITAELEKWYGVKIRVPNESKECRFYLNVDNETLPEVLDLFDAVSGAKSDITGKTITLNGNLCPKN